MVNRKIIDTIKNCNSFLILTHVGPDGDAIASSIAMWEFLVSIGKNPANIEIFVPHISEDLKFIDTKKVLKKECKIKNHELVIIVDCSIYARIEGRELIKDIRQCLLIDHHEGNNIQTDLSIIDTKASSCSCIIFRLFASYMSKNNIDFCRCISTGILSDTINLSIHVTDECMKILNECERNGINSNEITKQLHTLDARTKKLTDVAINRFELRNVIGCTYILQSDLIPEEHSLKTINHKAVIEKILECKGCQTLILLIETDDNKIKGSIRTKNTNVDLSKICEYFVKQGIFLQGGGHPNSAGFKIGITEPAIKSLNNIYDLLIFAILVKNSQN